jgi:hypothetical protein
MARFLVGLVGEIRRLTPIYVRNPEKLSGQDDLSRSFEVSAWNRNKAGC